MAHEASAPIAETCTSGLGASRPRRLRHVARAFVLDRLEGLLPGWKQDADEIDDRIGAFRGGESSESGKRTLAWTGVDLADPAERLK